MAKPWPLTALLAALSTQTGAGSQPPAASAPVHDARTLPVPALGSKLELSDKEWSERLTPTQYRVLRQKGTELAFTGKDWDNHAAGVYHCAGCNAPLFSSATKFDSGTGWPSFYQPIAKGRVEEHSDKGFFGVRTEIVCATCGGHLGHVFDDGPGASGQRWCINSAALDFEERE